MCDGERTQNARVCTLPTVEMFPHGVEMCVMPKYFAFVNAKRVAAFVFLAAAAGGLAAQADPVDVQQQLLDALARGDVAGAVALFTDDAVIDTESGYCAKSPCVGKAAIQKDFERYVKDSTRRVTPLNTFVSGNVLVTRFEARSAMIQKAGVERIILWGIREIRGDKIASSRCCLPDRTDSQTARFLEWDYAHPSTQ
jgi:hypothetical protein